MDLNTIIEIGSSAEQGLTVVDELTVGHTVAGMPMVFATPQMIQHMEVVAAAAIHPRLPEGWVSVGTRIDVEHKAATPVGFEVTTTATVVAIDGPLVTFDVVSRDNIEEIGRGRHVRAVIEMQRFRGGLERKIDKRPE